MDWVKVDLGSIKPQSICDRHNYQLPLFVCSRGEGTVPYWIFLHMLMHIWILYIQYKQPYIFEGATFFQTIIMFTLKLTTPSCDGPEEKFNPYTEKAIRA